MMTRYTKGFVRAMVFMALVATSATPSLAQRAGSTVQGDILRGQGQFLRGQGLYEMYSAKGRQIDAQTQVAIADWNRNYYESLKRERSARIQYKKNLTKAQLEQAERTRAEREQRYRSNPTDQDVVSGDALNALLVDLSDPSISSSSWRSAPVPLPPGLSIRSLYFRFAPRLNDKKSGPLSGNLIALGRLDPGRGWPTFLPETKVGVERRGYESAHQRVLKECEENGPRLLDELGTLDRSIDTLLAAVKSKVPEERNFRATAVRYVGDMKQATRIFDASTIDFAREMIRDAHDYQPQTVAELLAFMRKYRLRFAQAESPGDGDLYRSLYNMLSQQTRALRGNPVPDRPIVAVAASPDPRKAREQLVLAREAMNSLNFGGNPERRSLKLHAVEGLNVAINASDKGKATAAQLVSVQADIESLQKLRPMGQGNINALKHAAEYVASAVEALKNG